MTRAGRLCAGLASLLVLAGPALAGPALAVLDAEGRQAMTVPLPEDGRWCLLWHHSVAGFEVRDCFRTEAGALVLEWSHQPDFAAGLGEVPGRGTVRADPAGGYRIEGIEAPLPGGLALRRGGASVDHRIEAGGRVARLPGTPGDRLTLKPAEE